MSIDVKFLMFMTSFIKRGVVMDAYAGDTTVFHRRFTSKHCCGMIKVSFEFGAFPPFYERINNVLDVQLHKVFNHVWLISYLLSSGGGGGRT